MVPRHLYATVRVAIEASVAILPKRSLPPIEHDTHKVCDATRETVPTMMSAFLRRGD